MTTFDEISDLFSNDGQRFFVDGLYLPEALKQFGWKCEVLSEGHGRRWENELGESLVIGGDPWEAMRWGKGYTRTEIDLASFDELRIGARARGFEQIARDLESSDSWIEIGGKRETIPSAEAMRAARECALGWWREGR